MPNEDGAVTSTDEIYRVLLEVRDEARSVNLRTETHEARLTDHELRLRNVELHGSNSAIDLGREMSRTRDRLHALEGLTAQQVVTLNEHSQDLAKVATKKDVDNLADTLRETRSTLLKIFLLALTGMISIVVSGVLWVSLGTGNSPVPSTPTAPSSSTR